MRKPPTARHLPTNNDDPGAAIRERARETCGYHPSQDLFDARREIERTGGAEAILDRAVKRIERGQ